MKNIQVIDGAQNATFSVFEATDAEFGLIFPDGTDVAFLCDVKSRLTEDQIRQVFGSLWSRPVNKKTMRGIQGTYFADLDRRAALFPTRKEAEVLNSAPPAVEAGRQMRGNDVTEDG
jgi:hypothetical protein